eukprot:jgi/Picsp_1/2553/NSC_00784-R1_telomerase reverse transcriptase
MRRDPLLGSPSSRVENVPKLLGVILGKENLKSLRQLLLTVAESYPEAAELKGCLVQEFDHSDYTSLLDSTWCYVRPGSAPLQKGFSLKQYSSQSEVVHRTIQALLDSPYGRKNVLCYGYRKRGPSSQGRVPKNAPGMEIIHSMGTSESLLSASWEIVLSRIGDTLMIYLLLHVDMFVTLKNDCCFQLSGQPIITAARASKKTSEALQSKLTVGKSISMDECVNGGVRAQAGEASKMKTSRKHQSTGGKANGAVTQDLSLPTVGSCRMDNFPSIGSWSKRSSRPSSWRRKKMKKEMLRKNSQTPLKMSDDATMTPKNAYVTQQFGTDSTNSGRHFVPESRQKERYGHSQWPKYLCKPSDMVIQRPAIFYGSKYALRAGLPAKHCLKRLHGESLAGEYMYQYIFRKEYNPVAMRKNQFKPMHSSPVPTKNRVPKEHRHILPELRRMVSRANRCRFGYLLRAHCPLPSCFPYQTDQTKQKNKKERNSVGDISDLGDLVWHFDSKTGSSTKLEKRSKGRQKGTKRQRSLSMDHWLQNPPKRMTRLSKMMLDAQTQFHQHLHKVREASASYAAAAHKAEDDNVNVADLCASFVPHSNVSSFIWACIRKIVPSKLLGSMKAKKVLRRTIKRFVSLKRYENMTVHQAMDSIPLSEIKWVHKIGRNDSRSTTPPNKYSAQRRIFTLWIGWLFSALVVPLIRAHFYCTESEAYRQEVFYYRKPVWTKLVNASFKSVFYKHFVPIPAGHVQKILEERKLGVSRLRILPKKNGVRFLVNMSKKSEVRFKFRGMKRSQKNARQKIFRKVLRFPAINILLKNVHAVLKFESQRQPEAFGSSTFGFNDIFCRYKTFLNKWRASKRINMAKAGAAASADHGPYVVCVDVSRAFDNIDVATLLDVVSSILNCEEYTIVKYTEILSSMGDIRVKFRNIAVPSAEVDYAHFSQKAASLSNGQRGRIFVDAVTVDRISRQDILGHLEHYLAANFVRIKRKWRYQCRGIAQGGTPSTLLCSLYLGYVERMCIDPILMTCGVQSESYHSTPISANGLGTNERLTALANARLPSNSLTTSHGHYASTIDKRCPSSSHSILLRLVDDWLLISRHKEVAEQFAKKLLDGISGFNLSVNPKKTQVSFKVDTNSDIGSIAPSMFVEGDGSKFIKWCGLLVNTQNLELRADYTRYSGEHMGASINIPIQRNPGLSLGSKLCHYLRPKITPLLLDQEINSPTTVRINIYQAFLLGAMKFHCYLTSLPQNPRFAASKWLMEAIKIGIQYVIESTRPKMILKNSTSATSVLCDPGLPNLHVEYLGMHAFKTVLKRKQSRYQGILYTLGTALRAPELARCSSHLKDIVDPRHSAVFDDIIY